jgi:hypothetical protein
MQPSGTCMLEDFEDKLEAVLEVVLDSDIYLDTECNLNFEMF